MVEVIRGIDQRKVSEGLRKIPKVFTARAEFFGIEPDGIGITQRLLKEEPAKFWIG
jgi:hypothetical protein